MPVTNCSGGSRACLIADRRLWLASDRTGSENEPCDKDRELPLREIDGNLYRRTGTHFGLPLPRLQET